MKLIAGALAALLLAGATVVLTAGSAAAPAPKKVSLACAVKGSGKLQYVSKASDCPSSRGALVRFPQDRPVHACQLDKPTPGSNRAALPPPAHPHNVVGMLFRVAGTTQCHGPKHPNSHHVVLPKKNDVKLCAGKRHGTVRVVNQYSQCNSLEFAAVLKAVPAPQNHAPKANDQHVDVNENTAKSITLSGSDADGDPLTFTIVAQPSHGTLSGSGKNRTYTPASNYSGPDNFKFKVSDGHGGSNTGNVTITVHHTSDSPIVNTSAGSTSYAENGAAVAIDPALTVSDSDSSNLTGATVKISGAFQAGDTLAFAPELGITGGYDSGTGVLTLSGTTTVANYQQALRDVTFSSTNDTPSTPKTIQFSASDGTTTGPPASKNIAVTPVNDAPALTTTAANLAYTEGDGAVAIDSGLTAADPDSATLSGAMVQITSNFASADDELSFTNTGSITGSYDDTTGTMTLSGSDTVANYQAALRAVKYANTNPNPSGSKTVTFQAADSSGAGSNLATRTIDLQNANTAPTVTTTSGNLAYTEGDAAKVIDSGVTASDPDDTNLASAKVRISANFQDGDDLQFTDTATIDGTYDSSTGVLTLIGSDTVVAYQSALQSIKFTTTNNDPSASKTVEFTVDDGHATNHASNAATKGIAITPVNDAPAITTTAANLTYTEGDGAVAIDDALTLTDPDSATLTGATVKIASNFVSDDDDLSFASTATITGSYDDTTGVLTLSGSDTVANYQAALRAVKYTNTNPNPSGSKTVSFQADDGSAFNNLSNVATRTIDLQNANTAPTVTTTADPLTYSEGDPATVVDDAVTVSDPDDSNLASAKVRISAGFQTGDDLQFTDTATIDGTYDSSTGVLTLIGSDTVAAYQSALQSIKFTTTNDDPSTSKTVEFTADDGHVDHHASNAATRTIAISPANDAPTITTTAANLAYTEGDGAVAIDDALTLDDPDSTNISSAKVTISGNFVAADDELSFASTATITGSYDDTTGVLSLSGPDTVAHYEAALRAVKYQNVSQNPSGSKTISFDATDDALAASNTATRKIDLTAVNDAPVVTTTSGDTAYGEGDPPKTVDSGVTVSDADDTNLTSAKVRISSGFQTGDVLQFTPTGSITGLYDTTTGVLSLSGSSSVADYQTALQSVQYVTTNTSPSTAKTVEFTVDDGHAANHASNAATKSLAITPINSPPDVTAGGTLSYTENDLATAVAPALTVTEPEGDSLTSGSASITIGYQSGEDQLSWSDNTGADLIVEDTLNSTNQTIVLMGVGTAAQYEAALRAVKYRNTSEAPSNAARTVTFSATDVGTATGSDTRAISVTPVDDAPDAVDDTPTVTEDDLATAIPVLTNDTDVDGGLKEITAIGAASDGGTVTGTGGSANHWTGLTYKPAADYCNSPDTTPSATPETFTYTLNGGDSATVSVTVTCVDDNPVAQDRTFSAVGNTTLVGDDASDGAIATPDPTDTSPVTDRPHKTSSSDLRDSATDVDTPQATLSLVAETKATTDGGSVKIEADGDFKYEPKAGTSCTDHQDSFTYTVTDTQGGTDDGTVTVNISNCVRYVNNDDAQGDDGTSEKPYSTLAQAQTNSAPGDYIFVYDGNDTTTNYDAGIDLQATQKLIGEAATLTVGADTLHTADAANRPTITDSASDVVVMDDGNDVKGVELDPSGGANGGGIAAGTGDVSGNVDDVRIIDDDGVGAQQAGLEIDGSTGTWNISNVVVQTTSGATGIRVNNVPSPQLVNFQATGTITSESAGGKALDATSTNMGTNSQFDSLKSTNSNAGGIGMVNTIGTTHLGDGSGTDLDLTTTSGASAGLLLINAGTVDVPSAGTADVHATGGPAVDVSNTSGVSVPLDTAESTNSANDGINWDSNGTGTFSAVSGGTNGIKGASGIAVDVNAGSGNFSYPGKLDDGSGATADITGRTGGTVTLSGAISDGADSGGGITLSGNSGGTTDITNASKVLNTVAGNALTMATSNGHTLNLTNGGLDITTTSGKGLEADDSGTISVSGSSNKISTQTGRALNITQTDIGAADATFEKISAGTAASGPANGITLDHTATAGSLIVTGDNGAGSTNQGGNSSGGTIQKTSAEGVLMNTTTTPSFADMTIQNSSAAGVEGQNVDGFTYVNGTVSGAGAAHSDNNDSSIAFQNSSGGQNLNIKGALTVTNNVLSNAYGGGVQVLNYQGTISDANVSSNAISSSSDPALSKQDGIEFSLFSSPSPPTVASMTKGELQNNTITNFPSGNGISVQGASVDDVAGPQGNYGTFATNPGTGVNVISITGNKIAGDATNKLNGDAIAAGISGRGHGNFNISGNGTVANPLTNFKGLAVNIGVAGDANASFKVDDNEVNANNQAGANGIAIGLANWILANGTLTTPSANVAFTNNTVSNSSGAGIRSIISDSNATENLKIANNTVGAATQGNPGIRVDDGSSGSASFDPTLCSDISANVTNGSTDTFGDLHPGIELLKRSTSSTTYVFGIVGLSPSPATAAQTEAYVTTQNPSSSTGAGGFAGKKVAVRTGSNFTSCTLPF